MNIEDLTLKAQNNLFINIMLGIKEHANRNPDALPVILEELVEWLDVCDQDDFWGTEGWKHSFGVEA